MRLCDLDEIKIRVKRQYEDCHGYSGNKKAIYREAILAVKSILHSAKPIYVDPVRHGEWEIVVGSNGKEYMVCTCCRVSQDLTGVFSYCPNCGAKMDGCVGNE